MNGRYRVFGGQWHGWTVALTIGPDFLPCILIIARQTPVCVRRYIDWERSW